MSEPAFSPLDFIPSSPGGPDLDALVQSQSTHDHLNDSDNSPSTPEDCDFNISDLPKLSRSGTLNETSGLGMSINDTTPTIGPCCYPLKYSLPSTPFGSPRTPMPSSPGFGVFTEFSASSDRPLLDSEMNGSYDKNVNYNLQCDKDQNIDCNLHCDEYNLNAAPDSDCEILSDNINYTSKCVTGNSKSVLKDMKNLRLPVSPPVRGNVKFKRTKRYNNKENIKVGNHRLKTDIERLKNLDQ